MCQQDYDEVVHTHAGTIILELTRHPTNGAVSPTNKGDAPIMTPVSKEVISRALAFRQSQVSITYRIQYPLLYHSVKLYWDIIRTSLAKKGIIMEYAILTARYPNHSADASARFRHCSLSQLCCPRSAPNACSSWIYPLPFCSLSVQLLLWSSCSSCCNGSSSCCMLIALCCCLQDRH